MTVQDNRYPITVVTGFLGSGKTTLLSGVLKYEKFKNTAVIINEYGQAGLDHRLIRRIEEKTRLLSGGCICCNMRDDLVKELKEILNESERGEIVLERVVIETTGLADPAPILFSILMDPLLTNRYYVDGVVCCVDAANGELHLKNNNESVKQIVTADTVIITKTDIVDRDTLQRMRKRLGKLNPAAKILEAARGEIDPEAVLTNTQSRMEKTGTMERLENAEDPAAVTAHDAGVRSMSIKFYAPLDWTAFGLWMSMLLYAHGEKIMRIKGIVDVGDRGPIVINGVQHIIHPPQHLEDWNGEERNSQIVFIMKEIEPEQLMASLVAFQNILGSAPEISEINYDPYSGER
ncbi:MAG: GTP-binding protein [Lachnospiraceae bacterium]|nr:GTP-binding protein [Lachnospiraceae bacterium]